jgi:hypothetical protein
MKLNKASLHPDQKEVLRYLGYRKPMVSLSPQLESLLDECLVQGAALAEPRYRLKALPVARIPQALHWPQTCTGDSPEAVIEKAVFFLVTIGDRLESEVKACFQRDDYTRGVILDAVGTCLVETATDCVEQRICQYARHRGWIASSRFSPGYRNWPLPAQPALAALLQGRVIGVKVTASCMLDPQKTVSAAVLLGKERLPLFSRE